MENCDDGHEIPKRKIFDEDWQTMFPNNNESQAKFKVGQKVAWKHDYHNPNIKNEGEGTIDYVNQIDDNTFEYQLDNWYYLFYEEELIEVIEVLDKK